MEALIIGDLHGNLRLYQKIRAREIGKIILVGDLVDSRHFTRTEQLVLLEVVLDDIEAGRTECIFGNHEMGYLVPRMACSGQASSFEAQLIPLKNKMWKLMKPYILDKENKVLITHAGLSMDLINKVLTMDEVERFLQDSWRDPNHESFVYRIGRIRGGAYNCGGIFWCDWRYEFVPIPYLTQIFGHTPTNSIETKGNNWAIDCVEYGECEQIIKLTGNKVEVVDYEKISRKTERGSENSAGISKQT